MEGPFCRRNTGRGWSGDSDSAYRLPTRWAVPAGLPQGTHGSGQSTVTVARCATNEKIVRYQQGTAPLLPALSPGCGNAPFSQLTGPIVPTATLVLLTRPPYRRWTLPFTAPPNPSHGHQTTTKISDSFTERSYYNLQVIMAIELRDNSGALSCNLFLPSP